MSYGGDCTAQRCPQRCCEVRAQPVTTDASCVPAKMAAGDTSCCAKAKPITPAHPRISSGRNKLCWNCRCVIASDHATTALSSKDRASFSTVLHFASALPQPFAILNPQVFPDRPTPSGIDSDPPLFRAFRASRSRAPPVKQVSISSTTFELENV